MELKNEATLDRLANIFKNAIIPLLQEYFYEDYKKIQLVLGDINKQEEFKFILDTNVDPKLFGSITDIDIDEITYTINENAFNKVQAYTQVYDVKSI